MAQSSLRDQFGVDRTFKIDDSYINRLLAAIDARFSGVEGTQASLQDAANAVKAQGLSVLNGVIQPLAAELQSAADLGIFSATSETTLPIQIGAAVFQLPPDQAAKYQPTQWVAASSLDGRVAMAGLAGGYDRPNGLLTVKVSVTFGLGTCSAWVISPTTPPLLTAPVIDGGTFDPPGTGLNVAEPYTYEAEDLDGGTY